MSEKFCLKKTRHPVLTLIILTLTISFVFYKYQFIYHKNFYTVINNTIYRSAQPDSKDLENWQTKYKIQSILNLRGQEYCQKNKQAVITYNTAKQLGLTTKFLGLSSKTMPKPEEINEVIQFVEISPKPLLIHCKHGVDRTSMVAAIARILDNQPINYALREMISIKGFFPQRHQEILRTFIKDYQQWLSQNNLQSSNTNFKYWLKNIYTIDYYQKNYAQRKAFSVFSCHDWQNYWHPKPHQIL